MNDENKDKVPDVSHSDEMICFCFGVSRKTIEQAVLSNNLKGIEQITKYTHAGGGCRGCQGSIRQIIDKTRQENQLDEKERTRWEKTGQAADTIPLIKKIRIIESVLREKLKPRFSSQGVTVELVNIESKKIHVRFAGPPVNSREDETIWLKEVQSAIDEELDSMQVAIEGRSTESP
jgi:NifU-like protein